MPRAYYNEVDPYAAEWLRNLIMVDLIAPGDVDTRSIEDVTPNDLRGYTQCHFFAGIGVWSHALRLAGWPDDKPAWTGSCPCQPFSAAGQRKGAADERHLWPAWFWLIEQCRPRVIFGEQVEAAIKHDWLDLVQADLEGVGYATGAVGLPAASVGAPHGRARLWFVADDYEGRRQEFGASRLHERRSGESSRQATEGEPDGAPGDDAVRCGTAGLVGDADERRGGRDTGALSGAQGGSEGGLRGVADSAEPAGPAGDLAESDSVQPQQPERVRPGSRDAQSRGSCSEPTGSGAPSFWADCEWVPCRDGKARPIEPGTFPLAYGLTSRVGRLRAYGNAIVAPVAQEFIAAYMSLGR